MLETSGEFLGLTITTLDRNNSRLRQLLDVQMMYTVKSQQCGHVGHSAALAHNFNGNKGKSYDPI